MRTLLEIGLAKTMSGEAFNVVLESDLPYSHSFAKSSLFWHGFALFFLEDIAAVDSLAAVQSVFFFQGVFGFVNQF